MKFYSIIKKYFSEFRDLFELATKVSEKISSSPKS